jgi:hypothetical protein
MKTYARIADDVVVELVMLAGPIAGRFHPSLAWIDVTGKKIAVGWLVSDGSFSAPPPAAMLSKSAPTLASVEAQLALLSAQVAALRG